MVTDNLRENYLQEVKRYELKDIDGILSQYHSEYMAYKAEFDSAMNCAAVKHPMYVDIEVNNYCNMRCKMCRYGMDENENGKENMPIEVLDKLLHDCREIGVPSYFLGGVRSAS